MTKPSGLILLALLGLGSATNPTHYGDPKQGCESDEMAVRVSGLQGTFCSPKCSGMGQCPSDLPDGDSATPSCALKSSTTSDRFCALMCESDSDCGTGSCEHISGMGLCTYAATEDEAAVTAELVPAMVGTNPTHYGDPKQGCESDEMAVRVSGLQGTFCSPKCSGVGQCPSDIPDGD